MILYIQKPELYHYPFPDILNDILKLKAQLKNSFSTTIYTQDLIYTISQIGQFNGTLAQILPPASDIFNILRYLKFKTNSR